MPTELITTYDVGRWTRKNLFEFVSPHRNWNEKPTITHLEFDGSFSIRSEAIVPAEGPLTFSDWSIASSQWDMFQWVRLYHWQNRYFYRGESEAPSNYWHLFFLPDSELLTQQPLDRTSQDLEHSLQCNASENRAIELGQAMIFKWTHFLFVATLSKSHWIMGS